MPLPNSTKTGEAVANARDAREGHLLGTEKVRNYFGNDVTGAQVVDHRSLSALDRKELGIRDDEHVTYPARKGAIGYNGSHNPLSEMRLQYGDARVITKYVEGDRTGENPCEGDENVMCAVPMETHLRILAEETARTTAFTRKFRPTLDDNEMELEEDIFERTQENFKMKTAQNRQMFRNMNIGPGSPTSKMSLEDGLAYYARHGVDVGDMQQRARRGGHHSHDSQAKWTSMMSVGNTGIGKTTQQKVAERHSGAPAQLQARNARNAAQARKG